MQLLDDTTINARRCVAEHATVKNTRLRLPGFTVATVVVLYAVNLFGAADNIRLNQIGFCKNGPKTAIVISPKTWNFSIRSIDSKTIFYSAELSPQITWAASGETLKVADFSRFTKEGSYVVYVEGSGSSYPFTIANSVFTDVTHGLLKAFYYQRASTDLLPAYAGKWSRAGGHYDKSVIVHSSAASDPSKPGARKAGEVYPSPKGWYDAGDYGKYVVNAGITTYELLALYEQFPDYYKSFKLTIPESGNGIPDILNEIKWELDWLLTMQDPADGGVYHKVTDKVFIGDVMPANAKETRYFIGKGSAATFDFIGVCATAYRIYKSFLPSFADSCLTAARYAWEWGRAHPDSAFRNPDDIVTGEYGNTQLTDEFYWASTELFIATGDSAYFIAGKDKVKGYAVPSWPGVAALGGYSLALVKGDSLARARIIGIADPLVKLTQTLPYRSTMNNNDFYWGSNGVAANQGMSLIVAYLLTKNPSYLRAAIHAADYLLGRNATGYCFVTGYGKNPSMNPHHRPSTADNISAPVPGLLVGGPNSGSRDGENCGVSYPKAPAKAYLDRSCSFTTNEVAINWNAPAAFLAGAIDAILNSGKYDVDALAAFSVDTTAPAGDSIRITSIKPDRATVSWTRKEPLIATVVYSTDAGMKGSVRRYAGVNDSPSVVLTGLQPAKSYHVNVLLVDKAGNHETLTDSFITLTSPLYDERLYGPLRGTYPATVQPTVSVAAAEGSSVNCLVRSAFEALIDTLPLAFNGSAYTGAIPHEKIDGGGIVYTIQMIRGSDTLVLPLHSLVPETVPVKDVRFGAKAYHLTAIPGLFKPQPADAFFGSAFGDTRKWRFFGYQSSNDSYVLFDTLQPGFGGWLYEETNMPWSGDLGVIPADSLFPVRLHEGWNCIGNPFPFSIYWENSMIDDDGALVNIADSLATRFVRRQIFTYVDTTPDMINNGTYVTNRQLASHVYDAAMALDLWRGYWVYAEKDNVEFLLNPSPIPSPMLHKKSVSRSEISWTIECTISTGAASAQPVAFGCSEAAQDGYDPFDTPCPPLPGDNIKAVFRHTDWSTRQKTFIGDIQSATDAQSRTWTIDITGGDAGKPMLVRWQRSGLIPGNLYLRDNLTGDMANMAQTAEFTIKSSGLSSRQLSVVLSPENQTRFANEAKWQFTVTSGRLCAISFVIPMYVSGIVPVHIELFDPQGRKVAEPLSAAMLSGYHTFTWNRTTSGGTSASTGLYVAKLTAGSFRKTIGFNFIR